MAWNPSPKIADCREIAQRWNNKDVVIILAIDGNGQMEMATYGRTSQLCACAKVLGDTAFNAIERAVE